VHAFVNDLERTMGTYLYGRRMYETMMFWDNPPTETDEPPVFWDDARIWQAAEKVVYSRTLQAPVRGHSSSESSIPPPCVSSRRPREHASQIGGAELASQAIAAGLVDQCHLFLCPVVVGGGKHALSDNVRAELQLLDERRFRNGVVHLHYRLSRSY
jgi:dihydrofolate reductase